MLHNISLKYCSLQAGPMVQWTIHQVSRNAQTSPQPGLSSMMINDHCRTALHSWHWLQHTGGCRSSPQGRWTSPNSTRWWRSWSTQQPGLHQCKCFLMTRKSPMGFHQMELRWGRRPRGRASCVRGRHWACREVWLEQLRGRWQCQKNSQWGLHLQ